MTNISQIHVLSFVSATLILLSGLTAAFEGDSCSKHADCGQNEICSFYDEQFPPWMWPPCPHYGKCACVDGTVNVNSRCLAYINLQLYDQCTRAANERYQIPEQICDGRQVRCNSPAYVDANGYCMPAPTAPTRLPPATMTTPAPVIFTFRPPATRFSPAPVARTVYYRDTCEDNRGLTLCDLTKGLCCQNRGGSGTTPYLQCLCCDRHYVYDEILQNCRPRIYGDLCTEDEDCNSGLIASQGYECRLGRCRCQEGYDPVDNRFWMEGSRSTVVRRICIINTAVSWVPTGHECTMNPQQWSQHQTTRVCHPRAFCHQCFRERINANSSIAGPITGTCREFTCNTDADCGNAMICTNLPTIFDPPCDNSICNCPGAIDGTYMSRFSRCEPYRVLYLGDRCMTHGLNPIYIKNEIWDAGSQSCMENGLGQKGYAGYSWGVLKCKLPFVEDENGNCVRNDDLGGTLFIYKLYGESCDDNDLKIPRVVCDSSKGLLCRNRRCNCPPDTRQIWDGLTCRPRDYGDPCTRTGDCQTGAFYPTPSAVVCSQGLCVCAAGYTAQDIVGAPFTPTPMASRRFCFRSYQLVTKNSQCHLDPIGYAKKQGPYQSDPALICTAGTFCLRCPADMKPDDEDRGICRTVQPLPAAVPGPNAQFIRHAPVTPQNCTTQIQAALQDWRNNQFTAPTMPPFIVGGQPSSAMLPPNGEPFGSSSVRVDWKGVSFDVRTYVYLINNGSSRPRSSIWP